MSASRGTPSECQAELSDIVRIAEVSFVSCIGQRLWEQGSLFK